jgi:hypothetical protein
MIVEWIMNRYGWKDIWCLGSNGPLDSTFKFLGPEKCYVGIWTGPEQDLLCLRKCSTVEQAEKFLSPGGWTILHAVLLSVWRLKSISVTIPTEDLTV